MMDAFKEIFREKKSREKDTGMQEMLVEQNVLCLIRKFSQYLLILAEQ